MCVSAKTLPESNNADHCIWHMLHKHCDASFCKISAGCSLGMILRCHQLWNIPFKHKIFDDYFKYTTNTKIHNFWGISLRGTWTVLSLNPCEFSIAQHRIVNHGHCMSLINFTKVQWNKNIMTTRWFKVHVRLSREKAVHTHTQHARHKNFHESVPSGTIAVDHMSYTLYCFCDLSIYGEVDAWNWNLRHRTSLTVNIDKSRSVILHHMYISCSQKCITLFVCSNLWRCNGGFDIKTWLLFMYI